MRTAFGLLNQLVKLRPRLLNPNPVSHLVSVPHPPHRRQGALVSICKDLNHLFGERSYAASKSGGGSKKGGKGGRDDKKAGKPSVDKSKKQIKKASSNVKKAAKSAKDTAKKGVDNVKKKAKDTVKKATKQVKKQVDKSTGGDKKKK